MTRPRCELFHDWTKKLLKFLAWKINFPRFSTKICYFSKWGKFLLFTFKSHVYTQIHLNTHLFLLKMASNTEKCAILHTFFMFWYIKATENIRKKDNNAVAIKRKMSMNKANNK